MRKQSWSDKYLTVQTVSVLISFVFAIGVLYSEFKIMKASDEQQKKELQMQGELLERRGDSRFQRATEWNNELKDKFEKLEVRVRQLEIELSFEKSK